MIALSHMCRISRLPGVITLQQRANTSRATGSVAYQFGWLCQTAGLRASWPDAVLGNDKHAFAQPRPLQATAF